MGGKEVLSETFTERQAADEFGGQSYQHVESLMEGQCNWSYSKVKERETWDRLRGR